MFGLIVHQAAWWFLVSGLVASTAVQVQDAQSRSVPNATTHRTCYACSGPVSLCENLNHPIACPVDKQFCINELQNNADASRSVVRRCGTQQECQDGWFDKYSSNGNCVNFVEIFVYTKSFTCEFCCTSDYCNEHINPPSKFFPALG